MMPSNAQRDVDMGDAESDHSSPRSHGLESLLGDNSAGPIRDAPSDFLGTPIGRPGTASDSSKSPSTLIFNSPSPFDRRSPPVDAEPQEDEGHAEAQQHEGGRDESEGEISDDDGEYGNEAEYPKNARPSRVHPRRGGLVVPVPTNPHARSGITAQLDAARMGYRQQYEADNPNVPFNYETQAVWYLKQPRKEFGTLLCAQLVYLYFKRTEPDGRDGSRMVYADAHGGWFWWDGKWAETNDGDRVVEELQTEFLSHLSMVSQLFEVEFDPLNIDNTVQSMSNFLEKQAANLMTQQGAAKLLKECQKHFRKSEFCFDVDPDLLMFSNTKSCSYTKLCD